MTGATSGAGTVHSYGITECTPGFKWCLSCSCCPIIFYLVLVVMSVIAELKNDVRSVLTLICFVIMFMLYLCSLYLFTHHGIQNDYHIGSCSYCLTETRRVSRVEQELYTLLWHPSSSRHFSGVGVALCLICVALCHPSWSFYLFMLAILLCLRTTTIQRPASMS